MYFEDVFEHIGGHGVYQGFLLVYASGLALFAFDGGIINFVGGHMEHWCRVPALHNFTHKQQKYIAIPADPGTTDPAARDTAGEFTHEECFRFPLDFSRYTEEELLAWNRSERTGSISQDHWIECDHGWTFDQSQWVSTIGSEVL